MAANQDDGAVCRIEAWLVFLCSAGVCMVSGYYAWRAGQAHWDALAALSHAFDVVNKEPSFNLSLIGFVMPPLPALLYLPVCGFLPRLAASGLACPLLGSVMVAGAAVMLNHAAALAGLKGGLRWLLVAAFVCNPIILSHAAAGSGAAIMTFAVLGAAAALVRWTETSNLRGLITCSLLLTAAVLTRYESILIVIAATAYVAWHTYRQGDGWSRIEGTLIFFLLPIGYCMCVWMAANWAIVGDPLHFWHATFPEGAFAAFGGAEWTGSVLSVVLLSCPAVLGALYHELAGVAEQSPAGRPAAWLLIGAVAGAILTPGLHPDAGNPWLRLVTVSASVASIGLLLIATGGGRYVRGDSSGRRPVTGTLLLVAGGLALACWLRVGGRAELPTTSPRALIGGVAFTADTQPERALADDLVRALSGERTAYAIGSAGFAVSAYSGKPDRIQAVSRGEWEQLRVRKGDLIAIAGEWGPRRDALAAAIAGPGVGAVRLPLQNRRWEVFRIGGASSDG